MNWWWGVLLGFCIGALVARRARDAYWLHAARTGIRAYCRGKLYYVTEDPP